MTRNLQLQHAHVTISASAIQYDGRATFLIISFGKSTTSASLLTELCNTSPTLRARRSSLPGFWSSSSRASFNALKIKIGNVFENRTCGQYFFALHSQRKFGKMESLFFEVTLFFTLYPLLTPLHHSRCFPMSSFFLGNMFYKPSQAHCPILVLEQAWRSQNSHDRSPGHRHDNDVYFQKL